jgi:hypothetical protein
MEITTNEAQKIVWGVAVGALFSVLSNLWINSFLSLYIENKALLTVSFVLGFLVWLYFLWKILSIFKTEPKKAS